jgi:AAA15 family ATPase/GTPase
LKISPEVKIQKPSFGKIKHKTAKILARMVFCVAKTSSAFKTLEIRRRNLIFFDKVSKHPKSKKKLNSIQTNWLQISFTSHNPM